MRRLALVAHPSAELYGSDRVLLETIAGLKDHGWEVVVTLPTPGPLVDRIEALGVEVVRTATAVLRKSYLTPLGLPRLAVDFLRAAWNGARLLRKVRPDVIFVNTITIPIWVVLAKFSRVPVVCHVHEGESAASAIMKSAIAAPLLAAQSVIANSKFSAQVLEGSFSKLAARTEVIYNAVEAPMDTTPMRADLSGAIRVIYLGRLSPRKGVDVAVAAIETLNRGGHAAELDLVGAVFPGYEWYETELRDQVSKAGLEDFVRFCGFEPSIWSRLASCDVVVVPSRADEPFGNTAVEAILGGRPVVASASSGLLEATEGYSCALRIPPNDPIALAHAISDIAERWQDLRGLIGADTELAQLRHGSPGYRRRIADVVNSAATAIRPSVRR